jgi:hypothetical protein
VNTLGTMGVVFLVLWAVFGLLYWRHYSKHETLVSSLMKTGFLLGFIYIIIRGFDWVAEEVPAADAITLGIGDPPVVDGPRVPLLADAVMWFVVILLTLVAWYARRKFTTAAALMLSTWDRGNWFMLPVLFVLMTVGLLLVAAAASPVLSPFIYTLF